MPRPLKQAIVRQSLKKPSLDKDILSNYRPVSNLTQLSKVVKKVVAFSHMFLISKWLQSARADAASNIRWPIVKYNYSDGGCPARLIPWTTALFTVRPAYWRHHSRPWTFLQPLCRRFLPKPTKERVVNAIIASQLVYCNALSYGKSVVNNVGNEYKTRLPDRFCVVHLATVTGPCYENFTGCPWHVESISKLLHCFACNRVANNEKCDQFVHIIRDRVIVLNTKHYNALNNDFIHMLYTHALSVLLFL